MALAAAGLIIALGYFAGRSEWEVPAPSPTPEPSIAPYFVIVTLDTDVYAADQTRLDLKAGDRVKVVAEFGALLVIEHNGRRHGLNKGVTRSDSQL